ncbi:MAG: anthranilate synthase component II [Thermomicrobiales bacterium]
MIFMLDNYASFTFHLYQALREIGSDVEVQRNDKISVEQIEERVQTGEIDRIVISPGPCTPREAGISVPLVQRLGGRVPILGVCLGHQAIAAAYGGNVIQAPALRHGKTSNVHHAGKGVFMGLPDGFQATRYHSLIVERESLPGVLEVTAETDDDLIMGMRHREMEIEGVQFHPESILTPCGKDLLANFALGSNAPSVVSEVVAIGY